MLYIDSSYVTVASGTPCCVYVTVASGCCTQQTILCTFSLEMQVTEEEMADAKVPLNLRDYCAHLFIPLTICKKDNYYVPWKCKKEQHLWDDCQFQE